MSHLVFVPRAAGGPHFFAWPVDLRDDRSGVLSRLATGGRGAAAPIVDEAGVAGAVDGTAIPLDAALRTLAALSADALDTVPASAVVWALASKLALDLVARQRIVPVVEASDAGGEARWGVSLVLAHDADRVKRLAAAFPPAAHALAVAPSSSPHERRRDDAARATAEAVLVWSAEELLLAYLDDVADLLARTRPRRAGRPDGQGIERWEWRLARALKEPDADRVFLPAGVLERGLIEELSAWAVPARGSFATRAPRLCLKLDPPAGRAPWWRLHYLLQAPEDSSLLLPAHDVWASGGASPDAVDRAFGDAQEVLLRELSRAARILPPIEATLNTAKPEDLRLDAPGAWEFLSSAAPALADAGFGVLLPSELATAGPGRLGLRMHVGADKPRAKPGVAGAVTGGGVSLDALVDYRWEATLGDEPISAEEFEKLVGLKRPLVRWRDRWVMLDPNEIDAVRTALRERGGRMTSREAIAATLGGALVGDRGQAPVSVVAEGPLASLLDRLRDATPALPTPVDLAGELRPYQQRGLGWLGVMASLELGGCLADDMGLGKTIQTIAFLLARRQATPREGRPSLVVCPMSVVGNWERELARFAPTLPVVRHHGADRVRTREAFEDVPPHAVVVTTYGLLRRDRALLADVDWAVAVLDEAQNVKNAAAQQAVAARALRASHRFALTGTPVENRLAELWSILEFCVPGYLGPLERFRHEYAVPIERYQDADAGERLRRLVRPFVLRRLKSDPAVAADVPPKQEMSVVCTLTREQATLYQAAVDEAMAKIERIDGIARRGNVLALLTALKQICNHPAHYLREPGPLPGRSGKLARLTEMLEETVAAGDRALVFTQYTEMGDRLVAHLDATLGAETLYLHGSVPRAARDRMVQRFQDDPRAPHVFVLSLRAGGTGLNLTRATRVVHFDRWWNPAVEDQATDRAHRIGQQREVQVYRLVAAGTIEERIDAMLTAKRSLADRVVGEGETWITELSDAELRQLVTLSGATVAEDDE